MNFGKRHPALRGPFRHASLLVSAIALALALLAVPAQAEECTSSSCVQYNPSIPTADGGNHAHHQETRAKASKTGDGGGSGPEESTKQGSGDHGESDQGESQQGGVGAGGGNQGGPPQGKAGGSPQGKPGGSVHPAPQAQSAKPASSPDSGSSPLVPILIAIAVLAAISVGAVMYRQRRQRRGPTASASPEAS